MHTFIVYYGNKQMYVDACNESEAIDKAYIEIGYDPGDELFAELFEEDPFLVEGDIVDEAYAKYRQDILDGHGS